MATTTGSISACPVASTVLTNSDLSTPESGLLLGFEDSASFFRAYRDWTGATPKQSREAMRADR